METRLSTLQLVGVDWQNRRVLDWSILNIATIFTAGKLRVTRSPAVAGMGRPTRNCFVARAKFSFRDHDLTVLRPAQL